MQRRVPGSVSAKTTVSVPVELALDLAKSTDGCKPAASSLSDEHLEQRPSGWCGLSRWVWVCILVLVLLTVGVIGIAAGSTFPPPGISCTPDVEGRVGEPQFQRFDSCTAMARELKAGSCGWNLNYGFGSPDAVALESQASTASGSSQATVSSSSSPGPSSASGSGYSSTNVQEEGVDEMDIVKTDGRYVYTLSGGYGALSLVITDVQPANSSHVVVRVDLQAMHGLSHAEGMFVSGDRLLVVGRSTHLLSVDVPASAFLAPTTSRRYSFTATTVTIFDISDRAVPVVLRRVDVEGYSLAARMINREVFVVIGSWPHWYAYDVEPSQTISEDLVPFTRDDAGGAAMPSQSRVSSQGAPFTPITDCEQVGWVNTINADTTVTVVGFSLVPGGELLQLRSDTVAGRGFNVYASPTAIYVASGNFNWQQERTVVLVFDLVPGDYGAATKRGPGAAFRGIGSVPGTILSQWSMDEGADGSLRIATHTNQLSMSVRRWVRNGVNNVFVVNATATTGAALSAAGARVLPTVGALTGLAPGETIKASRFIGDRLYLVTFVRVDPLFVIDLSNASQPIVLGELKIPGFSEYLHPVNATHLIGVGHDTDLIHGRTVTTGVKLSLFNVGDVSQPREAYFTVVGGRGSTSEVLDDHKAFLFDAQRQLVALPLTYYTDMFPSYGSRTFMGALVFRLSPSSFDVVGGITHVDGGAWPPPSGFVCGCSFERRVRRSLFIGDNLFTISGQAMAVNSLVPATLLEQVATVELVAPP